MEPPPLRRSLLVALFVTIAWAASAFAVAGLIAVLLDRDPVQTPGGPVFLGLIGLAVAGIAVWLIVGFTARARAPWVGAIAAAAAVHLIVSTLALTASFPLFVEQAASPFVIAAALLAAAAVVGTWGMLRRPPKGRPPKTGLSGDDGDS